MERVRPDAEQLRQRTKAFALRILKLVDALPRTTPGYTIARQLARSATSVGANYRACCRARSHNEFIAKMSIVVEEADESAYWLELIVEAELLPKARVIELQTEVNELVSIFARSRTTAQRNRTPLKQSPNHPIRKSPNAK